MKNADKPINPEYYSNWNSNCQLQELVIDNESKGLSKREYVATEAMLGFISSRKDALFILSDETLKNYAAKSVQMADILLQELETTQK